MNSNISNELVKLVCLNLRFEFRKLVTRGFMWFVIFRSDLWIAKALLVTFSKLKKMLSFDFASCMRLLVLGLVLKRHSYFFSIKAPGKYLFSSIPPPKAIMNIWHWNFLLNSKTYGQLYEIFGRSFQINSLYLTFEY